LRGKYRVVFHISSSDRDAFERMISNLYNLLRDVGHTSVDAVVVANGDGIVHFLKSRVDEKTGRRLSRLREMGVRFYVCGNTLKVKGIGEDEVCSQCEVAPAGITLLVRLQGEGYAYIKP